MNVLSISWLLPLVLNTADIAPPGHSSRCVTDSAAYGTANFARVLMTSPDSFQTSTRSVYRLPRLTPREIKVVADSATCTAAAAAYFQHGEVTPDMLPQQVAVVRAGPYFFVELIMSPPPEAELWEIALFTRDWKRVVSFGGGS